MLLSVPAIALTLIWLSIKPNLGRVTFGSLPVERTVEKVSKRYPSEALYGGDVEMAAEWRGSKPLKSSMEILTRPPNRLGLG